MNQTNTFDRRTLLRSIAAASATGPSRVLGKDAAAGSWIFDNQCTIKNDPEGEGLRLIRQA